MKLKEKLAKEYSDYSLKDIFSWRSCGRAGMEQEAFIAGFEKARAIAKAILIREIRDDTPTIAAGYIDLMGEEEVEE